MHEQIDFSKGSVRKAVTSKNLTHPSVLYPLAGGFLTAVGSFLLFPELVAYLIAGGLACVSTGSFLINQFLLYDKNANVHIQQLYERLAQRTRKLLKSLREDLVKYNCPQGVEQLDAASEKYETFKEVLQRKLKPTELTFGRYLGIGEQVYLSILDNLQVISNILLSLEAIDIKYIEREIKNKKSKNDDLIERKRLYDTQSAKVQEILDQNEEALTLLVKTTASVVEMNTDRKRSSATMEEAMDDLQNIIKRAQTYQ